MKNRGFTLIELMMVVAIIGILAATAIPTMLTVVARAKTAETSMMIKNITESEVGFWLKPRYDASGIQLNACFLSAAPASPNAQPSTFKRGWIDNSTGGAFNYLGVASDGPVYYSYGVGASLINATFLPLSNGAGSCATPTGISTAASPNTNYAVVGAAGNVNGNSTYSNFTRNLNTDSSVNPIALGVVVTNEME